MAGFEYKVSNNVGYYVIDEFNSTEVVKTCFSTRIGGVSGEPYDSLNLGYKSGDDKSNVDKNFIILSQALGFNLKDMVLADQVHGDKCRIVDFKDKGKGIIYKNDIWGIDAMITNNKGVALCIFTADCVPVFILDKENIAVGLCHAGWRGVVSGIVEKTILTMSYAYNSKPQDIIIAIGPSIGPCCFYISDDVVDKFRGVFNEMDDILICEDGKYKINLWNAVETQLTHIGVKKQNIIKSGLCTSCHGEKFYSYRKDVSKTGRMISIIQLV